MRSTPNEGRKKNMFTEPGEVPCCLQCENYRLKRKLAKTMLAIKKVKKFNRKLKSRHKKNIAKLKILKQKNGYLKGQIVNVWLKDSHGIRAHSGTSNEYT